MIDMLRIFHRILVWRVFLEVEGPDLRLGGDLVLLLLAQFCDEGVDTYAHVGNIGCVAYHLRN